jgi:hypothetical protein
VRPENASNNHPSQRQQLKQKSYNNVSTNVNHLIAKKQNKTKQNKTKQNKKP